EASAPDIVSERRASSYRTTRASAGDAFIGGIPRYGKAPASCWRERVDNAGASFAWRAPSSSRPFEGTRVLTGYCTLVKGFGNSGWHKRSVEGGKGKRVGEGRWALVGVRLWRRPRRGLDRASIAPQQVERELRGRGQRDVGARHAEVVARVHSLLAADVGPVDPVVRRAYGNRHVVVNARSERRHGECSTGRASDLQVHLVVRWRHGLRRSGHSDCCIPRTLVHRAERHEGFVPAHRRDQTRHHDVQHRGQYHRNGDHQDGRDHGRHRSFILADDALHGIVLPGSFRRHVWTGGLSLLNVSWLMFNSENDFIKEPRRRSGKADRRYASREGPSRHGGSVGSSAELHRLVGAEDEHVPDLLRLVLLHRADDRIGPPPA